MSAINLKNLIADWYRCPICNEECYGLMSWAGHTAEKHRIDAITFEEKVGVWKSFFGDHWKFWKDGKEIKVDGREKVQFT